MTRDAEYLTLFFLKTAVSLGKFGQKVHGSSRREKELSSSVVVHIHQGKKNTFIHVS